MSETMQPPGPAGTTYIQRESRICKTKIVWMDKDEAIKLYACRAALRDCLEQMENCSKTRMKYGQAEAFVKAITNARKALGEQ